MQRSLSVLSAAALIAGVIGVTACQKSQSLTPTVPTGGTVTPADGSTLKASAPSPQSPVGDTRLETFNNPTLTASTAALTYGGGATLQNNNWGLWRVQANTQRRMQVSLKLYW